MVDILVAAPLLTLFLTIALGTLVGSIPFGPLKFGAAGALFVGLAIGALDPRIGEGWEMVQSIGLGLFVYTVGLASGASFFRDLRKQYPLMIGAILLLVVFAVLAVVADAFLDIGGGYLAGMMAGALTSTPALAAATTAAGGAAEPAVGYSIAYPVGVIVTMIVATVVASKTLPGRRDPDPQGPQEIQAVTVHVERPIRVDEIPGIASIVGQDTGEVRATYMQRDGEMSVARPNERLRIGDRLALLGSRPALDRACQDIGTRVSEHLGHDRSEVDHRRFVVSNPEIIGMTVADLHIPLRFEGIISEIRRGDVDMIPTAETTMEAGDRVVVVAPKNQIANIADFFGNSEKEITEIDFFSMGLGIALGVAVGLISIPLEGGAVLALGSAAGPLIVGLILGRVQRTGKLVWTMPMPANLTIRQFGLITFLAAVGLAIGQAFAQSAFTATGLKIALTAAVILTITLVALWFVGLAVGLSGPRTTGAIAGFVGQPALLNHANSLIEDSRTNSGYSALFALAIIVKILLVQALVAI